MIITYHGDNFFRVQNGDFVLVSDPKNDRMKPNLTLRTLSKPSEFDSTPSSFSLPGEFEVGGISITGLQVGKESTPSFIKTAFIVRDVENISLCFLGHLSSLLDSDIVESIGSVDILFLPLGDKPYLPLSDADKLVKNIEPQIVIPSIFGKESPKKCAAELGRELIETDKLVLKSKNISDFSGKLVVLNPSK